jgi:cobalt-zinc-cadmium efflux system outer membrane protein
MLQLRSLVGAAEADRVQSGLRPNPELGIAYRDEVDAKRVIGVTLRQKLETGGKRRARTLASRALTEQVRAEHQEAWVDVRAGVKEVLARLAYERESLALHRRLVGIREETLKLVGSLVGAGKASQVDHLRARERAALSRVALAERSASAAASRREARLAIGLSAEGDGRKIECSLEAPATPPGGFEALVALARENSPALASAGARRAVMDARVALARAGRVPDITVAAGVGDVELDSGGERNEFRLGISGELPLFDRNQGAAAAARHRLRASVRAEEVAAIGVVSVLSRMLADYEGRRAEVDALGATVLPAAGKRLALARDEMEAGKASKLEYLQRETEALRLRLRHLRARLMLALTAVQMEKLAGLLAPAE